jgi:hypothetical protein
MDVILKQGTHSAFGLVFHVTGQNKHELPEIALLLLSLPFLTPQVFQLTAKQFQQMKCGHTAFLSPISPLNIYTTLQLRSLHSLLQHSRSLALQELILCSFAHL